MVMHITLLQETRGTDIRNQLNTPLPVLWQSLVEDYNHELSFGINGDSSDGYVSEAQVQFTMPFEMAKNLLPISSRPQRPQYYWRRARYARIHDDVQPWRTWLIEGGSINRIEAEQASVTLNLKSPMAWIHKYPSRNGTNGKDLVGTKSQILQRLLASLSYDVPTDGEPFKMLPIRPFEPTVNQSYLIPGGVRPLSVDNGQIITVPAPDPLSIEEALYTVMSGWGSGLAGYGLTLVESRSTAPLWNWVIWKREPSKQMMTWAELALYDIEFSNEYTDVLTYNEDNQLEHRYMGGSSIANLEHNGAWLGVEFNGFKKVDPNGTLPTRPPSKPPIHFDGGGDYGWGGGGGIGGGIGGGGWGNPGVDGNTVFPTPDGGYISPGGGVVPDDVDARSLTLLVNVGTEGADEQGFKQISIPVQSPMPNGEAVPTHSWKITADGGRAVDIVSVPPTDDSVKIYVPADGQDHILAITPSDGNFGAKGWACRFGNGPLLAPVNSWLRMILAMGQGCFLSPSGKAMGHGWQFRNMNQLVSIVNADSVAVPTDTAPPAGFHYMRFSGCINLELLPEDAIDTSAFKGALPNDWRGNEIDNCPKVKATPVQQQMPGITSIGHRAFSKWVNASPKCKIGALPTFENATTVGDDFMMGIGTGCEDITMDPSIRKILPKAVSVGNNFMHGLNGRVSTTTTVRSNLAAAYLPLLPSLKKIGHLFLGYMYNSTKAQPGLIGGVPIDDMPSWKIDGWTYPNLSEDYKDNAMYSTFSNSTGFEETMRETQLPNLPGTMAHAWFGDMYRGGKSIRYFNPEVFVSKEIPTADSLFEYYNYDKIISGYRNRMYQEAMHPQAARGQFFMETVSRDLPGKKENIVALPGQSSGFRQYGFAYNGLDGSPGQRMGYTDGTEAIENQNGLAISVFFSYNGRKEGGGFYKGGDRYFN